MLHKLYGHFFLFLSIQCSQIFKMRFECFHRCKIQTGTLSIARFHATLNYVLGEIVILKTTKLFHKSSAQILNLSQWVHPKVL